MVVRIRPIVALCAALIAALCGWAAFAEVREDSHEQVYRIPLGTFAKRMAGERVPVLPSEIHLVLGVKDVLVLHNDDDVPQMFGPVLIMPGQRFQLPFRVASRYDFACSLHASGKLTIIVDRAPESAWQRVRWRTQAVWQRLFEPGPTA